MAKSKEQKTVNEQEESADAKEVEEISGKVDVKFKAIEENLDQKISPIIGYFPSGYDPLKESEKIESKKGHNFRAKVYRNARNPTKPRMLVAMGVEGSEVNFVGTSYSGEATTPQLCNYALGVLDKETGVLKMVPIAANRIFRLEPKVGAVEQSGKEVQDEVTAEEMANKARNLTLMYSSKKDIRKDEIRDTLRQAADPSSREDIDEKLKEVKIDKGALEAIASTASAHNIPPYDLEATSPDMAYPLDKIIKKGEWDYLLDIFELAKAGSKVTLDAYPSFVCNRVDKLETARNEPEKKRIAGIFSYITHLIKYKERHSMEGASSAKHHTLPTILSQKFSSMFGPTDKKGRLSDPKRNLLISYVLVLSLFADDFQSDPSDIAKDLRMNPLAIRTHYDYLGCKFVRVNHVLIATLPVPLELQTTKRKRRRGRG